MFKKLKKGFNLGYKVGEHEVKINYGVSTSPHFFRIMKFTHTL